MLGLQTSTTTLVFVCFFCLDSSFYPGAYYIALADLEFPVKTKSALNSERSTYLCLLLNLAQLTWALLFFFLSIQIQFTFSSTVVRWFPGWHTSPLHPTDESGLMSSHGPQRNTDCQGSMDWTEAPGRKYRKKGMFLTIPNLQTWFTCPGLEGNSDFRQIKVLTQDI